MGSQFAAVHSSLYVMTQNNRLLMKLDSTNFGTVVQVRALPAHAMCSALTRELRLHACTCDACSCWHTAAARGGTAAAPINGTLCTRTLLQVMIGASEVGSVVPLVKEGQVVKKVGALQAGSTHCSLGRLLRASAHHSAECSLPSSNGAAHSLWAASMHLQARSEGYACSCCCWQVLLLLPPAVIVVSCPLLPAHVHAL